MRRMGSSVIWKTRLERYDFIERQDAGSVFKKKKKDRSTLSLDEDNHQDNGLRLILKRKKRGSSQRRWKRIDPSSI